MNLLPPRLIIVGILQEPARRQGGVWVHPTPFSGGDAVLSEWIDKARREEWRQASVTSSPMIERLVALPGKPENFAVRSWAELAEQLLAMEPAQLVGQPLLNSVKELAPLLKLAGDIIARRSLIGFLRGANASPPLAVAKIAKELAMNPRLLKTDSVAFVRLSSVRGHDGIDASDDDFDNLMREAMSQLTSVAPDDHAPKEGPRLLVGETGSGKSELARALHQQLRAQTGRPGAFQAVNIAAVAPNLLESRLRGYFKGAFTDAKADQPGWFELADGGTLFLDEIQAAPIDFQVQLLDLLSPVSDTVEVERIGAKGGARKRCRVRVVMATNESEESLLAKGRLRKDLSFRIRARTKLKRLAERFQAEREGGLLLRLLRLHRWRSAPAIKIQAGRIASADNEIEGRVGAAFLPAIDHQALSVLEGYDWPGNLRELERVCFDAFLEYDRTGSTDWISTFRDAIGLDRDETRAEVAAGVAPLARMAREIEALLVAAEFNVSKVQHLLAVYKKKSPQALKKFLRENEKYLDMEKWTSRKAKELLGDTSSDRP